MSARLVRLVLRLYPRSRWERYGEEVLELAHELMARGDISRARLMWDMMAGALSMWRPRWRRGLLAGAAVMLVGTLAVGAILRSPHPAGPPTAHRRAALQRLQASVAPGTGTTCFVGSGPCSLTACREFIAQRSPAPASKSQHARPVKPRGVNHTTCSSYPRPDAQMVYVAR